MKALHVVLFLTGFNLMLVGCSSPDEQNETENTTSHYQPQKEEQLLDKERERIDEYIASNGRESHSLSYSNESGDSYKVIIHSDDKEEVLIYEENSSKGAQSSMGRTLFYMKGEHPFMTVERYDDSSGPSSMVFIERISYYDKAGKVFHTKQKVAVSEDDLENVEYKSVASQTLSMDRVLDIVNQQGKFELTFQGFILSEESLDFLLVGAPVKDGFNSALQVEHYDAFIKAAKADQKKYLNRKVNIKFHIENVNGYEYQVYEAGSWLE